jgi:RNA polymerase sigma-70 factor (ECF subfamily)
MVLLKKAQGGDMEAFATLFEEHRPTIHRLSCRYVGESDAYDLTMTVFLKAWQSLPGFQERASLKTWLHRILHSAAIDHLRWRRLREVKPALDPQGDAVPVDPPDERQRTPDQVVADREMAKIVAGALDALSFEHKSVIVLRYEEGMSYLEMATALGISIGTVMSRLFNARRRLRSIVKAQIKGELA